MSRFRERVYAVPFLRFEYYNDWSVRHCCCIDAQCINNAALHWCSPARPCLRLHDGVQWSNGQHRHNTSLASVAQVDKHLPIQFECKNKLMRHLFCDVMRFRLLHTHAHTNAVSQALYWPVLGLHYIS